jgi:hypothetical protein
MRRLVQNCFNRVRSQQRIGQLAVASPEHSELHIRHPTILELPHVDQTCLKAALHDVVDLLHRWADVHRALRVPDRGRLADAARYLQEVCFSITKYRLDGLAIPV